tara:strand:+ start:859 stop:1236 length:378 start_codon:yes stop_codon:yes gene_type:complete
LKKRLSISKINKKPRANNDVLKMGNCNAIVAHIDGRIVSISPQRVGLSFFKQLNANKQPPKKDRMIAEYVIEKLTRKLVMFSEKKNNFKVAKRPKTIGKRPKNPINFAFEGTFFIFIIRAIFWEL